MLRSHEPESLPWRPPPPALLAIGLALLTFHLLALGQQPNATEDQVKAAYLFNFAKLGEWPHSALPDGSSPLVIGVSGGDEEFLHALKDVVTGKIIGNHRLVFRTVTTEQDMKSCQIVFFRASARKPARSAIADLTLAGVLLVGEDESFLRQGGMINLVRENGSVRFEVSPDALERSQIHFSQKTLAMARSGDEHSPPITTSLPGDGGRRVERTVAPEYPAIAMRMNLTGTVQVRAFVKPDGSVNDVKVVGGHPLLADAVVRAVLQWKYQPAPHETQEPVKFTFGPQ
jgi:TonB family protein